MLLKITKTNADPPLALTDVSSNVNANIVWAEKNVVIVWMLDHQDFPATEGLVFDFAFTGYTGGTGPVVLDPMLPIIVNAPGAVVQGATITGMQAVCVGTVTGEPGYYKYDITVRNKVQQFKLDPMIIIEK